MLERAAVRLLLAEVALPLLLVATHEVGFAAYVRRTPTFPLPRLMNTTIDTGKYLAFLRTAAPPSPLDVVFLGISPMMRVSGRHLQSYMAERWQRPFRSFNFAAPFRSVEFDRRLLEEIVLPIEKPAVVVYGVMPINLLYEPDSAETDLVVRNIPAFALQGSTPASHLRGFLIRHLMLLEYREVLRDLVSAGETTRPDPWIGRARKTDRFGDLPLLETKWKVAGIAAWERKYVERLKPFASILQSTLLFAHLQRLGELCRARGIRLVVLLAPVHPFFLDLLPGGRRDYAAFVDRLRDATGRAGIPLFDPAGGGVGRAELFQDTHHHNRAGAEWLSEQIGYFLVENGHLAPHAAPASAQRSTSD